MKRLASLSVLACLWGTPALADLAGAHAALDSGDYRSALAELQPLAEGGNAEAALLLGRMAENGWGMSRSEPTAWRWYKRAADQGQLEGLWQAAVAADFGRGCPIDRKLAYSLYKRGAEAGDIRARGRIGEMALRGRGRKVDEAQAVGWLRQAAQADDPDALSLLDDLAADGRTREVPSGSAQPTEAGVRRILDEVRSAIALPPSAAAANSGSVTSGEVTALLRTDGSVLVTVPGLAVVEGPTTYKVGTVRLVFRDVGGDAARVDVLLPSRLMVEAADGRILGRVILSGQRFSGRWSFAVHGLTDLHGEAVAGTVDLTGGMKIAFGNLTVDRRITGQVSERVTAGETIGAQDLAVHVGIGGQAYHLGAGQLSWRGEIRGLDFAGYRRWAAGSGFDWRTGLLHLGMLAHGGEGEMGAMRLFSAATDSLMLDKVTFNAGDQPGIGIGRAEATFSVTDADQVGSAAAHLSYSHQGFKGDGVPVPPSLATSVSFAHLPVGELLRFGETIGGGIAQEATVPGADRNARRVDIGDLVRGPYAELASAFGTAGTTIHVDELTASGSGWDLAASGKATPANGLIGVALDAAVHGLDAMTDGLRSGLGATATETLRQNVRADSDDKGQPISRFEMVLAPGTEPVVNGRALTLGGW